MARHIPKRLAALGLERMAVVETVFVPTDGNTPAAKGALQLSLSSSICATFGRGIFRVLRVTGGVQIRRK